MGGGGVAGAGGGRGSRGWSLRGSGGWAVGGIVHSDRDGLAYALVVCIVSCPCSNGMGMGAVAGMGSSIGGIPGVGIRVPVVTEPNMSKCVSHPLSHVPRMPLRLPAVASVLVAQRSYQWVSSSDATKTYCLWSDDNLLALITGEPPHQSSSGHPGSSALLVIQVHGSKMATSEERGANGKILVNQ
jgi:hypothetical protein